MFPQILDFSDPVSILEVFRSCGFVLLWILLGFCSSILGVCQGILLLACNFYGDFVTSHAGSEEFPEKPSLSHGIFAPLICPMRTQAGGRLDFFPIELSAASRTALLHAVPVALLWSFGSFLAEAYRYYTASRLRPSAAVDPHPDQVKSIAVKSGCTRCSAMWTSVMVCVVNKFGFLIPLLHAVTPSPVLGLCGVVCACAGMSSYAFLTTLFIGRVLLYSLLVNLMCLFVSTSAASLSLITEGSTKLSLFMDSVKPNVVEFVGVDIADRVVDCYRSKLPYEWIALFVALDVVLRGLWRLYVITAHKSKVDTYAMLSAEDASTSSKGKSSTSRRSKRSAPQEYPENVSATTPISLTTKRRLAEGIAVTHSPSMTFADFSSNEGHRKASTGGLELLLTPIVDPKASFTDRGSVRRSARIRGLQSAEV